MDIKRIMLIRPGRRIPGGSYAQPLGLLYLVSVLRKEFPGRFEIDLVEQAIFDLDPGQVRARMAAFSPDVVGFSCMSLEADEMARLARAAKDLNPACVTILGGPHAKFFYEQALQNEDLDFAVLGEGERTFPELLKALTAGAPADEVRGLAFRRGGEITVTAPRELIEDLDSLPLPAWDLIDFARYGKVRPMNGYALSKPWAIIMTTRGCPFSCAYCHGIFGRRTRLRSPENVLAEIELLVNKYGVREIQFTDDIFNVDLPRAKRICDLIVERGLKISIAFPNAVRVDMMDRELLFKLKRAGCYVITYAIESASPRIQSLLGKNVDLKKAEQVIAWTREAGMIIHGFFMIGFPGETLEEMEMTERWAIESGLWMPIFFKVVVYPNTRLYELAREAYPGFVPADWRAADLQYRFGISFYEKATGIDITSLHRRMSRRGYYKFAKQIFRYLPFPKNLLFTAFMAWRALPRVWAFAGWVERYCYPRPEPPPPPRSLPKLPAA